MKASLFVVAVALIISLAACGSRPTSSQLSASDFLSKCEGRYYDERCKGKYVVWEGTIESVPRSDDYLRIKIASDKAIDLQGVTPNVNEDVEGRRLRFSGYIGDENFIHPDINDGKVEAYLNTKGDVRAAKAREAEEKAAEERRSDAEWERENPHFGECYAMSQGDMELTRECVSRIKAANQTSGY